MEVLPLYLRGVIRTLVILCLLSSMFTSCIMEDDTERPTAELSSPEPGSIVFTDDGLRVLAEMADNRGILQYKLVLAGIDSLNDVAFDSTYTITYIDAANEKQMFNLDQVLELPSRTFNGHYQLLLSCVDVEGNESFSDTVSFIIRNSTDSEPPTFNLSGVEVNDTLEFGAGLSPGGNIVDAQNLQFVSYYIGTTNWSDTIVYFEFPAISNNTVAIGDIGWYFQVDSTWSQGQHHIYATAWDGYSGISTSLPFHVKY